MNNQNTYFGIDLIKHDLAVFKKILLVLSVLMLLSAVAMIWEYFFFKTKYFQIIFVVFFALTCLTLSRRGTSIPSSTVNYLIENPQGDLKLTNTIREIYKLNNRVTIQDLVIIKKNIENLLEDYYRANAKGEMNLPFSKDEIKAMQRAVETINSLPKQFY